MLRLFIAAFLMFVGVFCSYQTSYIFEGLSSQWEYYLEYRKFWFFVGDVVIYILGIVMFLVSLAVYVCGLGVLFGGGF